MTKHLAAKAARKQRVRGKPFPKGKSGNPAGKRPGTRHHITVLAERLLSDDLEAVVAKVVKKARAGDMVAARLILDRIVPVRRGRAASFPLPQIATAADVVSALAAVAKAMSAGQLSPAEALEVAGVIEMTRRGFEIVENEARIAALEQKAQAHEPQETHRSA